MTMWPWKISLRRYFRKELKEVRHKLGGYLKKSDQVEGTASANGQKRSSKSSGHGDNQESDHIGT